MVTIDLPDRGQDLASRDGSGFERVSDPSQLKGEWQELQARTGTAFQSYEWFAHWMDTAGRAGRQEPAIVTCRANDGTLLALWPLVVSEEARLTVLTTPGNLHAAYHRPLVRPGHPAPAFFCGGDSDATGLFPDVDLISLDGLSADDETYKRSAGGLESAWVGYCTHKMALMRDWSSLYETKFSAKSRSGHRRKVRRLEQFGPLRFVVADTPEDRAGLLQAILEQKRRDLRAKGKPDPCALPGVTAFYERLAQMAPAPGMPHAVIAGLFVGEEMQAGHIGLVHRGIFHSLILSLGHGQGKHLSPGFILTLKLVEQCCVLGLDGFDFGAGDQRYKRELADSAHALMSCSSWLSMRGFARAKRDLLEHRARALALYLLKKTS